jgi:hypothetical protein
VEEKKYDPFAKGFSNKPKVSTNALKPEITQALQLGQLVKVVSNSYRLKLGGKV